MSSSSAPIASLTEKDYEWLRWALDAALQRDQTEEIQTTLVALRQRLTLAQSIPIPEQITQHIPQPKLVQQLKKKPPREESTIPAYGGQRVWSCKVGFAGDLPHGADGPMRRAIERAYMELTGQPAHFLFSGWGAKLTRVEREVVDDGARRLYADKKKP